MRRWWRGCSQQAPTCVSGISATGRLSTGPRWPPIPGTTARNCFRRSPAPFAAGRGVTIHAAVALGDAPRVRELVQADPGILRRIASNGGLVTLAVNHGQIEIVRLLLDLGADVDERIVLRGT